ncbi:hypothetical protein D3D03_14100 [Exiguobacterium sp. RIT452]|uniref:tetratricopeptide repeat protein n=1 Tax=Exiguobacterium sp. RIT452 TaxID=2315552 RepID=UPI000E75D8F3|nr:hypothetical protein [Exiguobacterium sp. RIT452]RJO96325.1 hypothetical protein D3D03_14100 [Exiguobacterium sp. RIT452]
MELSGYLEAQRIRRELPNETHEERAIKRQAHLDLLVRQAEFYKLSNTPDYYQAKRWLLEAIKIEKHHPIANYRLGYILYREREYEQAAYHLKTALDGTRTDVLSDTQLILANTFLVNCGVAITREALRKLEDLELQIEGDIDQERIDRYRAEMVVQDEYVLDRIYYRKIAAEYETIINEETFHETQPGKMEILLKSSDAGKTLHTAGRPSDLLNQHMFLTIVLLNQATFQTYPVLQSALSELSGQDITYDHMRQLIRRIRDRFTRLDLIEATPIVVPGSARPVQGFRIHPNWSVTILCRADDFIHPIQKERSDV